MKRTKEKKVNSQSSLPECFCNPMAGKMPQCTLCSDKVLEECKAAFSRGGMEEYWKLHFWDEEDDEEDF